MIVHIYKEELFGKINKIAVHARLDSTYAIENAIYNAERDNFNTICFYGDMSIKLRKKLFKNFGYNLCQVTYHIK